MELLENFKSLFLSVWDRGILGVDIFQILVGIGIFLIFLIFRGIISKVIIKRLEQAKDQKEESKKICLELIQIFREIKGVKGIHLMGHKKEEVIAEIIKESKIS